MGMRLGVGGVMNVVVKVVLGGGDGGKLWVGEGVGGDGEGGVEWREG